MNTASLELSKELYELSGWGTDLEWRSDSTTDISGAYPAYDLGFLLRKLPRWVEDGMLELSTRQGRFREGWLASYVDMDDQPTGVEGCAETPEDALTLLAIELFKQGILKKEVD